MKPHSNKYCDTACVLLTGIASLLLMPQRAPAAPKAPPPKPLQALAEIGVDAYEMAKDNQWKRVTSDISALEKAASHCKTQWKELDEQYQLGFQMTALSESTRGHQRSAAMKAANQITLIVARMTQDYAVRIPVPVTLLDVYGRDLEIAVQDNDANRLSKAAGNLRMAWNQVRSTVATRNSLLARSFETLVARVAAAPSPVKASSLVTPILDQVDELEKVF